MFQSLQPSHSLAGGRALCGVCCLQHFREQCAYSEAEFLLSVNVAILLKKPHLDSPSAPPSYACDCFPNPDDSPFGG